MHYAPHAQHHYLSTPHQTDRLSGHRHAIQRPTNDHDSTDRPGGRTTQGGLAVSATDPHPETPFVDTAGDDPTVVDEYHSGRCYGCSVTGGECEAMGLSFQSTDEWRAHRGTHHPVGCSERDCSVLAAYTRDGSPSSYCYRHIPDEPDPVFAWYRTNTDSVAEPPRAPADHPIEAALPEPQEASHAR